MAERVIWERQVDHDKIAERKQKFIRRFAVLAAVILIVVLIFSRGSGWLFALVLIAILGAIWGTAVRYQSLSDQANPNMVVDGGVLRLGRKDVFIEDVRRFTTVATEVQTSVLGKYSRIRVGKAIFRLDTPGSRSEPKLIEFGWPNMGEDGVATVKAALDPVLPDRWVEPADLVEEEKLPKGRRRRPPLPGTE